MSAAKKKSFHKPMNVVLAQVEEKKQGLDRYTEKEIFIYNLMTEYTRLKESTDKFAERMKENPFDALRWADDAFRDAAVQSVNAQVLRHFWENEELTVEMVQTMAMRETLRAAGNSSRSTSPSSNQSQDCARLAWASLCERVTP